MRSSKCGCIEIEGAAKEEVWWEGNVSADSRASRLTPPLRCEVRYEEGVAVQG